MILFPGRAGSTYLNSILDQHPAIAMKGEVLGGIRKQGAAAQLEWTHRYLRGRVLARARAVGFKTKLRDVLDLDGFASELRSFDARMIELGRANDVKHAVSRINARRLHEITGRWNRLPDDPKLEPIAIAPADLEHHLRKAEEEKAAIHDFVASLGLPSLVLQYEDLLFDLQPTLARLFGFLGVPEISIAGRTQKNTADDLTRAVTNVDELRAHFAGTRYEDMFGPAHESSH